MQIAIFMFCRTLKQNEFYIDKIIVEDSVILNLYHEVKPLYAELFGRDGVECRSMDMVGAYSSFEGSPLSEGKFQFDLWNKLPTSEMHNWEELRHNIMKYGVRNSLCVAPMPTHLPVKFLQIMNVLNLSQVIFTPVEHLQENLL